MRYNTKQRKLLLSLLEDNSARHLTADEIETCLAEEGNAVGRATIYRYLEALEAEGLVRRFKSGNDRSACFQFVDEKGCCEHFHLLCSECGRLIHMECDFLKSVGGHVYESHKFRIDSSKTVFYGVCEKCAQENGDE